MQQYNADSIKVLEGLEAVRVRPGMYIASTGSRGLHHLLWEIVDNAVDEAMGGFASEVSVTLHQDGSASVWDDGRGMPVDINQATGISGVELIFTRLHAGGKFGNDNYTYSGGLHGVGASVVNALSRWVTVDVYRDFSHWQIKFASEGDDDEHVTAGEVVSPLTRVGNTRKRGTLVRFLPDDRIFDTTDFQYETVRRRIEELAYLNKGIRMKLTDERRREIDGRTVEYCYEGGISDYVRFLNSDKTVMHDEPIVLEGAQNDIRVYMAMQYSDSYTESFFSYVNNIPTAEGGTHEQGAKAAMTRAMNEYARRVGLLKDKDPNLNGEDFREGLTCVLLAMVRNPQFEGQTKGRLGNTEVRPAVEAVIYNQMTLYLENLKHQELGQKIVEKAMKSAKVREAARKARDIARTKNELEAAPMVGKLSVCTGRTPQDNELFIVEGDSAGGSAKQGRDRRFQAILPLRGKPLNVEKKRLDAVLSNDEFRSLITALGTGIGEDFQLKNLKYHKVIILSDADQDGAHIRAILLTFFYRYMRELVTNGHVFIGMPPLYLIKKGDKQIYCYDDKELKKALTGLKGYTLQRYKGLGEMNPEQLWETTMDRAHRKLMQVTLEDAAAAEQMVSLLMGDRVDPRREYIIAHADFNKEDHFDASHGVRHADILKPVAAVE